MKVIDQSFEFKSITVPWNGYTNGLAQDALKVIESAGRLCYKTEEKITATSAENFIKGIVARGHHSVIEHMVIGCQAVTDRGVTHEIVRHRIASYSQESTRYCNYGSGKFGKEITVIIPVWFRDSIDWQGCLVQLESGMKWRATDVLEHQFYYWYASMKDAEASYLRLLDLGQTPQQARAVLPNSLKTEIAMTFNVREWIHFFNLRADPASHPQMVDLATTMMIEFVKQFPVLFKNVADSKGVKV